MDRRNCRAMIALASKVKEGLMSDLRPRITIRYCTQCRWLLRAAWLAQELLSTFGTDLGEVRSRRESATSSKSPMTARRFGSARPMVVFLTPRRSNVPCATGSIQVAISATSTATARTKKGSETIVKGKVPTLQFDPATRRTLRPSCRWTGATGSRSSLLTTTSRP